jgi:hypothetical protein
MAIMGSSKRSKGRVFDPIRNDFVAATAEELVRQALLQQMVGSLGFPKHLIAVEKDLRSLPHLAGEALALPERRADIICFAKDIHPQYPLYPLLLVECKDSVLNSQATEQLLGYNTYVKAYFVALASRTEVRLGYFDGQAGSYQFISFLPTYSQLMDRVKL